MENIFLVKIQTNVNLKKRKQYLFVRSFSHNIKIQNFDIQIRVIFLDKNLFFFARLTGFYIFGYLNVKFQPVGSYMFFLLY